MREESCWEMGGIQRTGSRKSGQGKQVCSHRNLARRTNLIPVGVGAEVSYRVKAGTVNVLGSNWNPRTAFLPGDPVKTAGLPR